MSERIQLLDDLGAEFARAFGEAEHATRTRAACRPRARTLGVALAIASLLAVAACAVPATRTAVGGIAGSLAGWVAGDDDYAPGRALRPGDHAPAWVTATGSDGAARLIAETHGIGLYVRRTESDRGPLLGFGLGRGFVMVGSLDSWAKRFDRHAIVVLGNSIFRGPHHVLDHRGRVPLFGVTARDVTRVELRYAQGPALVSDDGDGGFVLLVDAWRRMRELIAYDAAGRVVGRVDVSRRNLSYLCEKEPGCPSGSVR